MLYLPKYVSFIFRGPGSLSAGRFLASRQPAQAEGTRLAAGADTRTHTRARAPSRNSCSDYPPSPAHQFRGGIKARPKHAPMVTNNRPHIRSTPQQLVQFDKDAFATIDKVNPEGASQT